MTGTFSDDISKAAELRFTIPGRLPGLNEIIGAINRHRHIGARLKKTQTLWCAQCAVAGRVPVIQKPVKLTIFWFEKDRRRDLDNIAAGVKFVLDGLVLAGKLPNDTRRWVRSIAHQFPDPDSRNPRVEVVIAY